MRDTTTATVVSVTGRVNKNNEGIYIARRYYDIIL